MALENGVNAGATGAKHQRQKSSRVVPVIPRQLARASTVKKSSDSGTERLVQEKSSQDAAVVTAKKIEHVGQEAKGSVEADSPALSVNGTSTSKEVGEQDQADALGHKEASLPEHVATPKEDAVAGAETDSRPLERAVAPESSSPKDLPVAAQPPPQQAQSNPRRTLPPPFIPSAQSVQSGPKIEPLSGPPTGAMAPPRPFVFGAASDTYSSNPSPTPPASAGSGVSSSAHFQAIPGNTTALPIVNGSDHATFSAPESAHFSPHESHHNFYPVPPQYPQWAPSSNQTNHSAYPSQSAVGSLQNGHSQTPRSGSQTSLPPNEPQHLNRHQHSHHNSSLQYAAPYQYVPPQFYPGDRYSNFRGARNSVAPENNVFALQSYLDEQLGQEEFADCLIQFEDESKPLVCHALMLARNSTLRSMLRTAASSENTRKHLKIPQKSYFKSSTGYVEAVRYIYGGPTLNDRTLVLPFLSSPEALVTSVLSYAAAGCTLELPEVAVAALTVVSHRLSWSNLEVALEFALHGGISSMWRRYSVSAIERAKSEDRNTGPTYGAYASDVLEMVVRFICWNFVPEFSFDTEAAQLSNIKRFPETLGRSSPAVVHGPRSPVSDQRLRGIRLGSFQAQSTASSTLSSILLSVPLPVVQSVFDDLQMQERVNPMILESYMRAVVNERESRRQNALRTLQADAGFANGDAHSGALQKVLHTREEFELAEQGMPRFRIASHADDK